MDSWPDIEHSIGAATGDAFRIEHRASAGGGCVNAAWTIEGNGRRYFVKTNSPARADMFGAEAAGLEALRGTGAVRVPRPICHGASGEASWIVLEHLELKARTAQIDEMLGTGLAALHRHTALVYGWNRDNTIGATAQSNTASPDWPSFWRDRRLGFQLALAAKNGHRGTLQVRGEKLLADLPHFFSDYRPVPSLLHGDLWSGNAAADADGTPVVFDPAVYYGDREADIAMTELFGGFSEGFYAAYDEAYPLDSGYAVRRALYNLYHVLNHLNLFGGGYLRQAERMIETLVAET